MDIEASACVISSRYAMLCYAAYVISYFFDVPFQFYTSKKLRYSLTFALVKSLPLLLFLARDSMLSALYAIARPSVRPSVTRVDQSKTVERIIEILSPSDRPNILVFRHQRSLRKSDGFTPNGGAKYKGGSKN